MHGLVNNVPGNHERRGVMKYSAERAAIHSAPRKNDAIAVMKCGCYCFKIKRSPPILYFKLIKAANFCEGPFYFGLSAVDLFKAQL